MADKNKLHHSLFKVYVFAYPARIKWLCQEELTSGITKHTGLNLHDRENLLRTRYFEPRKLYNCVKLLFQQVLLCCYTLWRGVRKLVTSICKGSGKICDEVWQRGEGGGQFYLKITWHHLWMSPYLQLILCSNDSDTEKLFMDSASVMIKIQ